MIIFVTKDQICNLGRLPCQMSNNPLYKTCLEISRNTSILTNETSLYQYYQTVNFKTLCDLYNIEADSLNQYRFDSLFLPWIHTRPVLSFFDPTFLSTRPQNLAASQVDKLTKLIASIKMKGYVPELHLNRQKGHITGYFLSQGDKKRFYVVSGNHRASVLSALFPNDYLKVIFEKVDFMKARDRKNNGAIGTGSLPNEFKAENVNKWPSVKSGFITEDIALKIFRKYINA